MMHGGRATDSRAAIGCAVLFLVPFAAAGTICAALALSRAQSGSARDALFLAIAALVFGGVGFGGLASLQRGARKLRETERLRAAHPEEPWLWRGDWAAGRLDDNTAAAERGAWIFAALWNLVSIPAAYAGIQTAVHQEKPIGLVALLFPLVGLWLLLRAAQATIRRQKYGTSRLELSTIPGVIGGTLAGVVYAPGSLRPAGGFRMTLTCLRRVTRRTGRGSSRSETILWQEESQLAGEQVRDHSGMRTRIPFSFMIPAAAEPSEPNNPGEGVEWRLELSAPLPGVDYESMFVVPVFNTGDASGSSPQAADYRPPPDSQIVVTSKGQGTELSFPAGRNPGPAAGLTAFMAIWWALIPGQLYLKAPLIFPLVTAGCGVLIGIGVLELWLRASRVTVDESGVTLASGYLQPGRGRKIPASEISDVASVIGMQSGKTVYYDVVVRLKNGKKKLAGRSVRNKREAEWLASTIKKALRI